ncbi:MAG: 30S ribosomal protein S6 [Candidatus Eiseniibacteriota bacterium]
MHEYETVFILDPGLDENQVNDEVEKTLNLITSHGGKIVEVQRWGRKRLAYEIRKKRDGVYTMIKHESTGEVVRELERRLRLNDNVMRVMTVIAGPEYEMPATEGEGTGIATGIAAVRVAAEGDEVVARGAETAE